MRQKRPEKPGKSACKLITENTSGDYIQRLRKGSPPKGSPPKKPFGGGGGRGPEKMARRPAGEPPGPGREPPSGRAGARGFSVHESRRTARPPRGRPPADGGAPPPPPVARPPLPRYPSNLIHHDCRDKHTMHNERSERLGDRYVSRRTKRRAVKEMKDEDAARSFEAIRKTATSVVRNGSRQTNRRKGVRA